MKAWYHTFFNGLPQVAWKAAQTHEQTQLDLELLVENLDFGPGDRILDIFCGYGRHAIPLARMGAWVTGVDISTEYIAGLQLTIDQETLPMEAIEGDFLDMAIEGTFHAAYCMGNSFSFFPADDMLRFLQKTEGLLRPGGLFLAHTSMVAEVILPDYQERSWMNVSDDITFLSENTYDPMSGRIDARLTYIQTLDSGQAEIETRTAEYHIYSIAEIGRMAMQVGLELIDCYGTVDGQPFAVGDEAAWMLFSKPAD
ncbi:methyltransferase domain-containing protein [Arsenicibacter rosenii]|uniref:SAM-dependent methyltransferase n=1 Tax=Arsenicibacter rosenii TaxID=1750698 RepID=A0A1S2VQA0_9BACT|nr:methyltransferase domain-containing protein [Arsenicibacter rosenii]OIN60949.1 SAM-dependent methyltransferase [Arsenicibacter rosenii]